MAGLEARAGPAAGVAERHGVSRTAPYAWRREAMGGNGGDGTREKGAPVGKGYDGLPDDMAVLRDMLRETRLRLRQVRLGLDVRRATLGIVKTL